MCRRVPGAHIHRGHRVDQRVMRVLLGHSGDPFESAQCNAFCCKAVPPLRLATQRNATHCSILRVLGRRRRKTLP